MVILDGQERELGLSDSQLGLEEVVLGSWLADTHIHSPPYPGLSLHFPAPPPSPKAHQTLFPAALQIAGVECEPHTEVDRCPISPKRKGRMPRGHRPDSRRAVRVIGLTGRSCQWFRAPTVPPESEDWENEEPSVAQEKLSWCQMRWLPSRKWL
ncbi:hypothetical protein HJG60_010595 [Phyllostomus discolor]|uniref:Uncharacterized protein n=1 Tax=Phyllostomus discolor TaxID=89673 RepID=A0A834EF14_9CHIR|nr:hypothetical protein HJG60_010595 [Phyllostomus discolor]